MRVGGMVKKGSIVINQKDIQFIVTDFENNKQSFDVKVSYFDILFFITLSNRLT